MRNHIFIIVTVMASLLVGCSDSPQHKFSLAERMLKEGKPNEALELVNSILEGDLEGEDAEAIHDGSFFADWVHDCVMLVAPFGLIFLVSSGLYLWLAPKYRKRRRRRIDRRSRS